MPPKDQVSPSFTMPLLCHKGLTLVFVLSSDTVLFFFFIFYQSPGRSNKALFLVGNKQFAVYSRESRYKNRNKKYIFSVLIYPRFFHVDGYSFQNNHETHLAVRAAPCQRGVSVPRLLGLSVEWLSSIIWPLTGGMSFTPSSTC